MFLKILAIALLIGSVAYGQSLGDVARENREKKAEDASSAPPKVITNKDLPKDPNGDQEAPPAKSAENAAASTSDQVSADHNSADHHGADNRAAHRAMQQRMAEQRVADQWKRQILAQKEKMAVLQARIDELKASIRAEYGTVQYEGPYNQPQARQLQRVAQMQQQLDLQQIKLAQMQEAARQAGMHTVVYDP
jgi:hypothetical protein